MKLKEEFPLQVIVKGIKLENLINTKFLRKIKNIYPRYNANVSTLHLILENPHQNEKEKIKIRNKGTKTNINLNIIPITFIKMYHRNKKDVENSRVIIESNDGAVLKKLLKEFK